MMKDAKELMKNSNYIKLGIVYTCMYGVYTSMGAILNTLVQPYGFGSADAAEFGGVFITCGLVGSFVASGIIDKYSAYKKVTCAACWGTLILGLMLLGSLSYGNKIIVSINIAALGFFILPIIPIGYSFAVEITFPVSEVMSNGTMSLVAQLFGTLLTAIASEIHSYNEMMVAPFLILIIVIPCILCFFVQEDLRRAYAESEVTPNTNSNSFFDSYLQRNSQLKNSQNADNNLRRSSKNKLYIDVPD